MYYKPKRGYAHADPFSLHKGEDEVVVPFGVNIIVRHVMRQDDTLIVYLEEI
jgi:hypothetical protein